MRIADHMPREKHNLNLDAQSNMQDMPEAFVMGRLSCMPAIAHQQGLFVAAMHHQQQ